MFPLDFRQTAVTADLQSEKLLLFVYTGQHFLSKNTGTVFIRQILTSVVYRRQILTSIDDRRQNLTNIDDRRQNLTYIHGDRLYTSDSDAYRLEISESSDVYRR